MAISRKDSFLTLWRVLRRRGPGDPTFGALLSAVPRLIRARMRGQYKGMTFGSLIMMLVALAYMISPIDLIPESVMLLLGLTDDTVVGAWLAGKVLAESGAFLEWENSADQDDPKELLSEPLVGNSQDD